MSDVRHVTMMTKDVIHTEKSIATNNYITSSTILSHRPTAGARKQLSVDTVLQLTAEELILMLYDSKQAC